MHLSQLLGVEDSTEKHLSSNNYHKNGLTSTSASSNSNSDNMHGDKSNRIINLQMINILQSQRDSYKDKLTKVLGILCII